MYETLLFKAFILFYIAQYFTSALQKICFDVAALTSFSTDVLG